MNVEYVLVDLISKRVSKTTHTLQSKNELSDLFESLDAANALLKEVVVAQQEDKKTVIVFFNGVSARVPMAPEEQASPRVKEILKLSKTNLTDGVKEEQKRGVSWMPSKKVLLTGVGTKASLVGLYKLITYKKKEKAYWFQLTNSVQKKKKKFETTFELLKTDADSTNWQPELGNLINSQKERSESLSVFRDIANQIYKSYLQLVHEFEQFFHQFLRTKAVKRKFNGIILPLTNIWSKVNFETIKSTAYVRIYDLFTKQSEPYNEQVLQIAFNQIIRKFNTDVENYCKNLDPLTRFQMSQHVMTNLNEYYTTLQDQLK